jgi:hypothetical protein
VILSAIVSMAGLGVVAGAQEQGEPGGQRVESGIDVRGSRGRGTEQRGVEHRLGAWSGAINPGRPRRAGRATRVPGVAAVASACVRSAS